MKDDLRAAGLPFVYTPHPIISMSDDKLYEYITGNDPITGKAVISEIIECLTKPVTNKDISSTGLTKGEKPETAFTGYLDPDTEDNLQQLFYDRGWTDGLPVILPTEERVEKMLSGTCASPDEVVGEVMRFDIRGSVKYTVKDVAVIAVMAGAKPEYFPVILAVAATGSEAIMPSTTAFASMVLVNGPIRNEIGMNSGVGAFSPVTQANSVIGRAWTLMSTCWGYMKPRINLWSSQGNNLTYNNMCVAENEEASAWEPFHVQKGFKPDESVVSIFRGWTMYNSAGAASIRSIGEEMCLQMGGIPATFVSATIVMDPIVARTLKDTDGFKTKQDYSKWLSENIKIPAEQYWGYDHVDWTNAGQAEKGVEPYTTWKKLPGDTLITPYHVSDRINLIVVGGETSPLWKSSDYGYVASASIDKWMAAKSGLECKDGTCGLPDEMIDYD